MKKFFSSKLFSLFCAILNGIFAISAFLQGSWLFGLLCFALASYCFSNFVENK
jgi:hypothetical protein